MMSIGAPPVKMLFDQLSNEGKRKVKDSFAGIINNRFGNGPISINNTATFGIGTASSSLLCL